MNSFFNSRSIFYLEFSKVLSPTPPITRNPPKKSKPQPPLPWLWNPTRAHIGRRISYSTPLHAVVRRLPNLEASRARVPVTQRRGPRPRLSSSPPRCLPRGTVPQGCVEEMCAMRLLSGVVRLGGRRRGRVRMFPPRVRNGFEEELGVRKS